MNKKRLISHYKNGQSLFTENKAQMISKEMKKIPNLPHKRKIQWEVINSHFSKWQR